MRSVIEPTTLALLNDIIDLDTKVSDARRSLDEAKATKRDTHLDILSHESSRRALYDMGLLKIDVAGCRREVFCYTGN